MTESQDEPPPKQDQPHNGLRYSVDGFLRPSSSPTKPKAGNDLPLNNLDGPSSSSSRNTSKHHHRHHHRHASNEKLPSQSSSPHLNQLYAGAAIDHNAFSRNSENVSEKHRHTHSRVPSNTVRDGQHVAASTSQEAEGQGVAVGSGEDGGRGKKRRSPMELFLDFRHAAYKIITYSWVNVLLVFVPIAIICSEVDAIPGSVAFAMNAIAIIPLAGLLSHATECVARKLGDTIGALMNVTFGNAVELIIFIIALEKNKIRIVQSSLLGSILANELLILGMGFFLGGLRYREQLYNSTVTQMSACLLSLSVVSLVLPVSIRREAHLWPPSSY